MPRKLCGLFVLLLVLAGCDTSINPSNPFDPQTPANQQAKAKLSGVVYGLDRDSGDPEPLAGAIVALSGTEEPKDNPVETSSAGVFNFGELTPGAYTLDVFHQAYFRQVQSRILLPGEEALVTFILDRLPEGITDETGHVTGVVQKQGELHLDPELQDHSGIVTEVVGAGIRTTTNAAGQFDLYLNAGAAQLTFAASNHVTLGPIEVEVLAGQSVTVPGSPLVLTANPGQVTGTVLLEGDPAGGHGGIDVVLLGSESTQTQPDGSYVINDVPAGTFTLVASKENYDSETLLGIVVRGGLTTQVPDITLMRARGRIIGQVELLGTGDSDHSGVNISLTGTSYGSTSGYTGEFAIESVPTGTYDLVASKEQFSRVNIGSVVVVSGETTDVGLLALVKQQGNFSINGGQEHTNQPEGRVTLTLVAPDNSVEIKIEGDLDASESTGWRAYDPTATLEVILSPGDGLKTLTVTFRDDSDPPIESPPFSDSIILDRQEPVPITGEQAVLINGGAAFTNNAAGQVTLTFNMTDGLSGLSHYRVSNDGVFDNQPPGEEWRTYAGSASHTLADPGTQGTKTVYAEFRDFAGNQRVADSESTAAVILDYGAPQIISAELQCPQGVTQGVCNSATVIVAVSASDDFDPSPLGVSYIALANEEGFLIDDFRPYTPTTTWSLSPGDGTKTVYIKLRDAAGNPTSEITRSIDLDTLAPQGPLVIIAGGAEYTASAQVQVTLSVEGGDWMRVSTDPAFTGVDWVALAPSTSINLDPQGTGGDGLKTVYAAFRDDAGNATATIYDTIFLDRGQPSSGSVVIDGGAGFAKSPYVTLTLDADDDVTQMRISVDPSGAFTNEPWVAFAETSVAILPPGDCSAGAYDCKLVTVLFRDAAGNQSVSPAQDWITLDSAPPSVPLIVTPAHVTASGTTTIGIAAASADSFFARYEVSGGPVCYPGGFAQLSTTQSQTSFSVCLDSAGSDTNPQTAYFENNIRLRAVDQAGNLSDESSVVVTRDTVPPATPLIGTPPATVNADFFSLFMDTSSQSHLDATFDHYEIRGGGFSVFTPTSLTDGLTFNLNQGDAVSCDPPCQNVLEVRAVDAAGNLSGIASVSIFEDSVLPTIPVIHPDGPRVNAETVTIKLLQPSSDTAWATYQKKGGSFIAFTDTAETDYFLFDLEQDETSTLCIRGKDLAGNVGIEACTQVSEQSTRQLTATPYDETNPDILGDYVTFLAPDGTSTELFLHNLRDRSTTRISGAGSPSAGPARMGGDFRYLYVFWEEGGNIWVYRIPHTGTAPEGPFQLTFTAEVESYPDTDGSWVVYLRNGQVWRMGPSGINQEVVSASACAVWDGTPRVAQGTIVWCDDRSGNPDIYRRNAGGAPGSEVAVASGPSNQRSPAVSESYIFYTQNFILYFMEVDGTPNSGVSTGLWAGNYVTDADGSTVVFYDVDGTTGDQDVFIHDVATGETINVFDDASIQKDAAIHNGRIVWEDQRNIESDIFYWDRSETKWLIIDVATQKQPAIDGDLVAFWDYSLGTVYASTYDFSTGQQEILTGFSVIKDRLAVGGSFVVGRNSTVGEGNYIRAWDTSTSTQYEVTFASFPAEAGEAAVAPGGERVVWRENVAGTVQIFYDTLPPTGKTQLTFDAGDKRHPDIAGDVVVFIHNDEVYCQNIADNTEQYVAGGSFVWNHPVIWGQPGSYYVRLAYEMGEDIFFCNLSCPVGDSDCTARRVAGGPAVQVNPEISENAIVYESDEHVPGYFDIYLFDIESGAAEIITQETDEPYFNQANPAVSGDRVVWEDRVFLNADIFVQQR